MTKDEIVRDDRCSRMKFDLETVLSVTTGKLFCSIENVYKILNYMTGDNLFTHQLPRASDECKPFIIQQYPQLADVDIDLTDITDQNQRRERLEAWLSEQRRQYGSEFGLTPIPARTHSKVDLITEVKQQARLCA